MHISRAFFLPPLHLSMKKKQKTSSRKIYKKTSNTMCINYDHDSHGSASRAQGETFSITHHQCTNPFILPGYTWGIQKYTTKKGKKKKCKESQNRSHKKQGSSVRIYILFATEKKRLQKHKVAISRVSVLL